MNTSTIFIIEGASATGTSEWIDNVHMHIIPIRAMPELPEYIQERDPPSYYVCKSKKRRRTLYQTKRGKWVNY